MKEKKSRRRRRNRNRKDRRHRRKRRRKTRIKYRSTKITTSIKSNKNDKTHDKLLSQIVVEQQDKRGDTVEYTKEDEETSKNRVEMQYTYTDLQIEKE